VTDHPLVSVLIPTYNRAHCLANAIDSALAQTYPHVEIVVVDDGSQDHTGELIAARYGDDPRVRYVYQQNGGVSAARNHGLRLCRGELVAFLDSDDLWLPWKLELQVACLSRFPDAVLAWSEMQAVDVHGQVLHERYLRKMYHAYHWFTQEQLFAESSSLAELCPALEKAVGQARVYRGDIYAAMLMGNLVHTSTVLDRRDVLARVGDFDEAMRKGGEDFDFHLRTARHGPVLFLDLPLIQYQIGLEDQITGKGCGIHYARSHLSTITRELKQGRPGYRFPRRRVAKALGSAHAWLGEELLELGHVEEGRRHLLRSARLDSRGRRKYFLLLASMLPSGMEGWLRKMYRRARVRNQKGMASQNQRSVVRA
jgi:glycosyltransferase involved in cell wall biosynthesis